MSTAEQTKSHINLREFLDKNGIHYADRGEELALKVCPFCHGDTEKPDNQFKNSANETKGVFNCVRCEAKGTIAKLVDRIKGPKGPTGFDTPKTEKDSFHNLQSRFIQGHTLDEEAAALGRRYFDEHRGLLIPESSEIRFHPSVPYCDGDGKFRGDLPAIVSRIRDFSGNHIGTHFIYLDAEGRKTAFTPAKKVQGRCKGGFLTLGEPSHVIAVAEGVETACAVHQATGQTTFCCFNAYGIRDFALPTGVKEVHIWADQDRSRKGERVGKELAQRLHSQKVKVYFHLPRKSLLRGQKSVDFLDVLRKEGNLNSYLERDHEFEPTVHNWPEPMAPEAKLGLVGPFLDLVGPSSEADPNAHVLQFLIFIGNILGRTCTIRNGALEHFANLFAVIVGSTARGRKGTGLSDIKRIIKKPFADYAKNCIQSGATSGEGIIFAVRDQVIAIEKNEDGEEEEKIVDPGAKDKRCLLAEAEFQQVLTVSARAGNNLSSTIRSAWDGDTLQTLSKNSPCRATEHCVSMIGQITPEELRKSFSETDIANGFGNRILWCCSRKSKELPIPPELDRDQWSNLSHQLAEAIMVATRVGCYQFTEAAQFYWRGLYHELGHQQEAEGAYGKVISRNTSQVLRLSLIYAVLDRSEKVDVPHIMAARAVWDYCQESAFYLFGDLEGTPAQRKILRAIEGSESGMSRAEIGDLFHRHLPKSEIDDELADLKRRGFVDSIVESTGGRNATRWFAV